MELCGPIALEKNQLWVALQPRDYQGVCPAVPRRKHRPCFLVPYLPGVVSNLALKERLTLGLLLRSLDWPREE